MDLGLKNKKALVVGSSRGLGYAIAKVLSKEGTNVVLNSRTEENLISAAASLRKHSQGEVHYVCGDVSKPEVPDDLINKSNHLMGGLDILITNSGGPPVGQFQSFDDDDWRNAIDLVLMSHVRMIRSAIPFLEKSESASVLTVTSFSVKQPVPNLVLSNSIRAATVGLTKTLSFELGDRGIRFNSILPGWTETERVREIMSARAEMNQTTAEEEIQKQASESPLGRMASPDEFAKVAVFLCSPAASYLTGIMLTVDGGMYKGTL